LQCSDANERERSFKKRKKERNERERERLEHHKINIRDLVRVEGEGPGI
jgi:hypothetical protein